VQFCGCRKTGNRIGIDLLELKRGDRLIVAVDYFSRKLFAQTIETKECVKIVKFLEYLYAIFPFKEMITDNGKEFDNNLVKNWVIKNKVNHIYSIPYYHQSNGRVERINRAIRNAFKKTPGPHKNES
jgi:IS30 family transposase